MKEISIKDLKQRLSAVLRQASTGTSFVVTNHNKPVAQLRGTDPPFLHRGRRYGRGQLTSVLRSPTRGKYLDVLADDRKEGRAGVTNR